MKCRRSNASRGAKLRGSRADALPADPKNNRQSEPATVRTAAASQERTPGPGMRIDARTQGPVHYSGKVTVGPDGAVIGNLYAATIIVEGEVVGDIHAEDALRVAASARIIGNMASPKVAVARGAQLRGSVSMRSGVASAVDLDERAVDVVLSGSRPG